MSRGPRNTNMATIMQLVDDLEQEVSKARRIPATGSVAIDSQRTMELIDQLRIAVPTELQQARRIVQDRQSIIIEAQEEGRRIVETARERAEYMVSDSGLLAEARQISEERLRHSDENARRTKDGVERYALNVIESLEETLRTNLQELQRAKGAVRESPETHGALKTDLSSNAQLNS